MTSPIDPGSSQPHSREEFQRLYQQSIGGTFFRQMMKALRSTTGQAAYFNGGQAEKIFQGQLDELMIEKLSEASGGMFSDAMFEQQFPEFAQNKNAKNKNPAPSQATGQNAGNRNAATSQQVPPPSKEAQSGESVGFDTRA